MMGWVDCAVEAAIAGFMPVTWEKPIGLETWSFATDAERGTDDVFVSATIVV